MKTEAEIRTITQEIWDNIDKCFLITDTIWLSMTETLFDRIEAIIAEAVK